jgi:hypothetical protein
MTAFTDALDLRTAVIEHVNNFGITDVWPRLVIMAELGFNRKLRCREQITRTTLTLSSGSVALPSNFAEMIGVHDGYGREYVQQPVQQVKSTDSQGYYAITGTTLVSQNGDAALDVEYYAKIPTLTTSLTTSNWLLQKYPGLYLYAVGTEAAKYMRDLDLAQTTKQLLDMEYAEVQASDDAERYSRARVRIPGVTP